MAVGCPPFACADPRLRRGREHETLSFSPLLLLPLLSMTISTSKPSSQHPLPGVSRLLTKRRPQGGLRSSTAPSNASRATHPNKYVPKSTGKNGNLFGELGFISEPSTVPRMTRTTQRFHAGSPRTSTFGPLFPLLEGGKPVNPNHRDLRSPSGKEPWHRTLQISEKQFFGYEHLDEPQNEIDAERLRAKVQKKRQRQQAQVERYSAYQSHLRAGAMPQLKSPKPPHDPSRNICVGAPLILKHSYLLQPRPPVLPGFNPTCDKNGVTSFRAGTTTNDGMFQEHYAGGRGAMSDTISKLSNDVRVDHQLSPGKGKSFLAGKGNTTRPDLFSTFPYVSDPMQKPVAVLEDRAQAPQFRTGTYQRYENEEQQQ